MLEAAMMDTATLGTGSRRKHTPSLGALPSLPRWFSTTPLRRLVDERRRTGQGLNNIAEMSGIARRRFQRALARERLRSDTADACAVALGRHPSELWPEWFGG